MCGITGIFEKFRGNLLEKKIAMMTNQLVHRGPDNIKTLFDEKINNKKSAIAQQCELELKKLFEQYPLNFKLK